MRNDMNQYQTSKSTQSGFVALFSVVFFALLAMVITVGFIRIMNIEQQQALNNDLTARALSAAEAGVEDAKRAIAHYANMPANTPQERSSKDQFRTALNGNECNSLFRAGSPVAAVLGLNPDGVVASGQNLAYTCLTVDLDTADYLATVGANQSQVIPMRSSGTFDRVKLEWHLNSGAGDTNGDGIPSNNINLETDLPTIAQFGADGDQPPAFMRVQLIGKPNTAFNRNQLEDRSRTVFLTPFEGGVTQFSIANADDPGAPVETRNYGFNAPKSPPIAVDCDREDEAENRIGQYACGVTVILPGGSLAPSANEYYLQVTPLYRGTHVRASLFAGSATDDANRRNFNAAQPRIDSNGVAADTFRRVEVRTNFPGDIFTLPRYGAEVGDNICKNFHVTDSAATGWKPNECS